MLLKSAVIDKFENLNVFDDLIIAENFYKNYTDKSYIHQIPSLPNWTNKVYKYYDYQVNLFKLTCSCEDYLERSKKYKRRDYRKACKHIYYKLQNEKIKPFIDDLTLLLVKNSAIFHESELFRESYTEKSGKERIIYFGHKENNEWLSVYTNPEGAAHYVHFGFNIVSRKWSYNTPPYDSDSIVHFIDRLFSVQSKVIKNN